MTRWSDNMPQYKMIVNPVSGRGAGGQSIPALEQALIRHDLDYDLERTQRPWQAAELARAAVEQGYGVVVAVGGDGTANEVLNGLVQACRDGLGEAALGVVSVGRGNDLAYGMGIPAGVEAGVAALAQGRRKRVDVGRVAGGLFPQGRFFGNGVGIGFDAVVGFEALKLKRLHGFPSYIVAALKTIFLYYKAPRVQIEFGDKRLVQPSLMVSVMNGRRMGGGFHMAPEAAVDDGFFDLCIARQVSRGGILALIPRFMQGTQASHPAIRMERAARLTVTALEGVLPAHADGETLCVDGTALEMELLPGAVEVIGG